jgi:hypothetical protein
MTASVSIKTKWRIVILGMLAPAGSSPEELGPDDLMLDPTVFSGAIVLDGERDGNPIDSFAWTEDELDFGYHPGHRSVFNRLDALGYACTAYWLQVYSEDDLSFGEERPLVSDGWYNIKMLNPVAFLGLTPAELSLKDLMGGNV